VGSCVQIGMKRKSFGTCLRCRPFTNAARCYLPQDNMRSILSVNLFRPKRCVAMTTARGHYQSRAVPEARVDDEVTTFLRDSSINFHFTRKCNFACSFCFHTEKSKECVWSALLGLVDMLFLAWMHFILCCHLQDCAATQNAQCY
jgi:hypothetical protein